jgi:uncharacterized protein YhaN
MLVVNLVFNLLSVSRNKGKDATDSGYIKAQLDMLLNKFDKLEAKYDPVFERLARVESAAAQAHHRIDRLEKSAGEG